MVVNTALDLCTGCSRQETECNIERQQCDAMQTANLVKDIRMERFEKIDKGLQALEGPITVKLNNVSAMECNMIRHFFQGSLNQFYKLAQVSNCTSWLHNSILSDE